MKKYFELDRTSIYRNHPKFLDRFVLANSADQDQTNQGIHCLLFHLQLFDKIP